MMNRRGLLLNLWGSKQRSLDHPFVDRVRMRVLVLLLHRHALPLEC